MTSTGAGAVLIALLRVLPRNGISRLAGRIAELPLPRPLRAPALRLFGRAVGVDFSEVRDQLHSFPSLQAFFTRALREGARPIDATPDALVSPCDGAWGESGRVREGQLLQLKGRPYSLTALLGGDHELARRFEGGCFATFYLSPRDYHRFHSCCHVRITSVRHVPGTLWPVNQSGLASVDGLFAENERICARMQVLGESATKDGSSLGSLCLVAIGATMVGRVRLAFDSLTSNRGATAIESRSYPGGVELAKGAEWGRFEFGSTLVLLAEPGAFELEAASPGTPLRLGRRIGRIGRPREGL